MINVIPPIINHTFNHAEHSTVEQFSESSVRTNIWTDSSFSVQYLIA
jgi:hypothetical protein